MGKRRKEIKRQNIVGKIEKEIFIEKTKGPRLFIPCIPKGVTTDAAYGSGTYAGQRLFIPCIPLIPSENIYSFQMRRKQFTIRPALAMTANKAHGQTLSRVRIYLPEPLFSHGQQYVGLSRGGPKDNVRLYMPKENGVHAGQLDIVVYTEVLA
ncbi:PIF1 helicase [Elysia marginata]|uniref:PIF1 helicase n=1 Tax=Elysia marginata TaxID=1093978 RepID=A0AAV4IZG5_9GAST|nr:PIF1 helicase [Elysia marginata]